MSKFSKQSPDGFAKPQTSEMEIPIAGHGGQHNEVLQNFVDAILFGKRLIAPAEEGIHSVELANAMLFSSATRHDRFSAARCKASSSVGYRTRSRTLLSARQTFTVQMEILPISASHLDAKVAHSAAPFPTTVSCSTWTE